VISSKDIIKNRILITGSNGMLGERLVNYFMHDSKVELLCCSIEDSSFIPDCNFKKLDITDKDEVKKIVLDFYPDFIINTAAYTNVDKSEIDKLDAWNVNVKGVENISQYAKAIDTHVLHISSDYIFDGKKGPYTEIDKPDPVGYYGRTKLAAENVLRLSGAIYTIIRTNVLYGPSHYGRPDFVRWLVQSLKKNQPVRIVTDQINNPTYLDDILTGLSKIINKRKQGIFNIAGKELLSRFRFSQMIAEFFNLDNKLIEPVTTAELNQTAKRPLNSGLIILKAITELDYSPTDLFKSLELMKNELNL